MGKSMSTPLCSSSISEQFLRKKMNYWKFLDLSSSHLKGYQHPFNKYCAYALFCHGVQQTHGAEKKANTPLLLLLLLVTFRHTRQQLQSEQLKKAKSRQKYLLGFSKVFERPVQKENAVRCSAVPLETWAALEFLFVLLLCFSTCII